VADYYWAHYRPGPRGPSICGALDLSRKLTNTLLLLTFYVIQRTVKSIIIFQSPISIPLAHCMEENIYELRDRFADFDIQASEVCAQKADNEQDNKRRRRRKKQHNGHEDASMIRLEVEES
jgi:hypothetical protein